MFTDKLKSFFNKENLEEIEGNQKKKIESLVFFVIVLIITIIIINTIWNGDKNTTNKEENVSTKKLATTNKEDTQINEQTDLENKLKQTLSKIQGVGDVEVMINYSETSEVVAMYNENSKVSTTEETDTSGGVRKIEETDTQKDIVYQEENGEKTPITQKTIQPKIEGAIIISKGAGNSQIKANIIQAVEAVTGLATHKIQVFEMNT